MRFTLSIRSPQSAIVNRESSIVNRVAAFTLVELLVVIAIIVILIGAVIMVGRSRIAAAKASETAGLLNTLQLAAQQFASEKPLSKVKGYQTRYGDYPPDELDGFLQSAGVPSIPPPPPPPSTVGRIAPSGSDLEVPTNLAEVDHGDIKAFALAIRSYSQAGAAILDRIQPKYRAAAHKASGVPDEYLDRNGNGTFDPGQDEPLDYFMDGWGTPVAYFATTPDSTANGMWDQPPNVRAAGDRWKTCAALRSLSNDVPVFVSYGPDGPEQFSDDFREPPVTGYHPDLIYDFNEPLPKPRFKFDHLLNRDNVYSSETVQDKILRVAIQEGLPI
ncbi:MAG: prepilin-type N-terminal cleavage/methylation domain-containing protein [Planctomycetota bacterium]